MNDEIKEILDKPKILMLSYGNYISLDDYVKLKDYITNLQQDNTMYAQLKDEYEEEIKDLQKENERLKEIMENLTTMTACGDNKQIKNTAQYKLDIYKLRIDKAINLIESYNLGKYDYTIPPDGIIELLDILKGDSDE